MLLLCKSVITCDWLKNRGRININVIEKHLISKQKNKLKLGICSSYFI